MKVKELIEILSRLDQEETIEYDDDGYGRQEIKGVARYEYKPYCYIISACEKGNL